MDAHLDKQQTSGDASAAGGLIRETVYLAARLVSAKFAGTSDGDLRSPISVNATASICTESAGIAALRLNAFKSLM